MLLNAPCSLTLSDKAGSMCHNTVSVVEWGAKRGYRVGDK